MTDAMREAHHARMQRVLEHIDRHADGDLRLGTLSSVAAFFRYHFHRQFAASLGVTLHRYVQLVRMKRASYRLAFRDGETVTTIAMDAGYEAPEAFTRAFRQRFGQAPTSFRQSPDWASWHMALAPLAEARTAVMQEPFTLDQVRILEVPATAVAVMDHRGDAARLSATIQRFIAWRRAARLPPKVSATFTIFHDPEPARPEDFHLALCAATHPTMPALDDRVTADVIPAGRCAVLRVIGSSEDLGPAATFLYRDWLPASGEETRDFPLYCRRLTFFPDVPEREAVTDLFLPLR